MTALAEHTSLTPMPTDDNAHAETYRQAIRDERTAETNSIIAAWRAGHVFRTYDDPPHEIARVAGVGEQYVRLRIRLAGAYTLAALTQAVGRSGCTHFTAFYSWTFSTGAHASNQMFPRRNVHVPQAHTAYFEAIGTDVAALLKDFLAAIDPAELHALIRARIPC